MQLTLYNLVYTGLPIFFYLFDYDFKYYYKAIQEEEKSGVGNKKSKEKDNEYIANQHTSFYETSSLALFYQIGKKWELFNWKKFFLWDIGGMVQGFILLYFFMICLKIFIYLGVILVLVSYFIFLHTEVPSCEIGFISYISILFIQTILILNQSHTLSLINYLFILGCFIIVIPITFIWELLYTGYSSVGVFYNVFSNPYSYSIIFVNVLLCYLPVWLYSKIKKMNFISKKLTEF
jgi:hypothetical protein